MWWLGYFPAIDCPINQATRVWIVSFVWFDAVMSLYCCADSYGGHREWTKNGRRELTLHWRLPKAISYFISFIFHNSPAQLVYYSHFANEGRVPERINDLPTLTQQVVEWPGFVRSSLCPLRWCLLYYTLPPRCCQWARENMPYTK